MTGCIVGWAHTKFGKLEGEDAESLIVKVARDAVADAGIAPADVDAVYVGFYNGGFSRQDFAASLVLQAHDDFRFKPVTRVENACATGSAAVHQGLNYLEAKRGRIVLAVGVEKMTDTPGPEIGGILMKASYLKEEAEIEGGFAGVFGRIAQQYFQKYGDQTDALARIASKNHKNGCANPWAQMQKDLSVEFCRDVSDKNPLVAGPLKRTDCSLVSDGAAAVVLADMETALAMKKAVVFRARNHVNEFLPMSRRDMTFLEGAARAWEGALKEGRLSLDDLSLVETHDCFTVAELMEYEAMGLAPWPRARSPKAGRRRTASCRSIRRAGSRRKVIRSARPASRCTSWRRCRRAARRPGCRSRTPRSPASSTWAAPAWRITSAFSKR